MTDIAVLGIDLGKNSCSVAGLDETGHVVLRRRVSRDGLAGLLAKLRPCTVAMEACCGAHHVGRSAEAQGHRVRLMPPEYVRPYVKAQKNDDRDAEAIAEAATRPTMRFVPLKEAAQLDVQALHRARERLVAERTALINQMRALLLERGIVLPQRWRSLAGWVDAPPSAGEPDPISPRIRLLVTDMRAEWLELDRRIALFDDEFLASARQDEAARRLATVPGIGPINATALVAAVGDASAFGRARDLAAWFGRSSLRSPRSTPRCLSSPRLRLRTSNRARARPTRSARACWPAPRPRCSCAPWRAGRVASDPVAYPSPQVSASRWRTGELRHGTASCPS